MKLPISLLLFVVLTVSCLLQPATVRADEFDAMIDRYLAGDDAAPGQLLGGGMPALMAIEKRVLAEEPLNEDDILRLVEQLDADMYADRERASRGLERAGDAVLPLLARLRGTTESPEVRYRLDILLDRLQSSEYQSALPNLLIKLYETHIDEIAPARMAQLFENPHNEAALLFVKLAPSQFVVESLEAGEVDSQILYLLARLYTLHDRAGVRGSLRDFDGEAVLEIAAATYWPHELEPLTLVLGRWRATYAAHIEGTTARDVISFSLEARRGSSKYSNPRDTAEVEGENSLRISGCNSFLLWIYLWRYEPPADGEPVDGTGAGVALGVIGPRDVRMNVVAQIAEDMPLPVVRVSDREKTFWITGSALEWARPFIPPEYVELVRFRQRTYDAVEILSTPE